MDARQSLDPRGGLANLGRLFHQPLMRREDQIVAAARQHGLDRRRTPLPRSEEHTSELQSLMRSSYAVFCWKNKKRPKYTQIPPSDTNSNARTAQTDDHQN